MADKREYFDKIMSKLAQRSKPRRVSKYYRVDEGIANAFENVCVRLKKKAPLVVELMMEHFVAGALEAYGAKILDKPKAVVASKKIGPHSRTLPPLPDELDDDDGSLESALEDE